MHDRPYVVCHIVSSVDGKIDGSWFGAPQVLPALKASGGIRDDYACTATLYGATTMAQTYAEGWVGELPDGTQSYPREDFIAPSGAENYFVVIDPKGEIAYDGATIEKRGRPKAHVVEVLLEGVADAYLAYLRQKGISYIFAGKDALDPLLVLQEIKILLHVERLMICGGGVVDYTFLQAGLIDELSLVMVPLTDGGVHVATVFDQSPFTPASAPIAFKLLEVKTLPGDGLWLRYQPTNQAKGVPCHA